MNQRDFVRLRNLRQIRDGRRSAGRRRKSRLGGKPVAFSQANRLLRRLRGERERLESKLYRKSYRAPPEEVKVTGELGLEEPALVENFLDCAERLIDCESSALTIDLSDSTRIWPSGVTLLCSLKKWVELCKAAGSSQRLASVHSKHAPVNCYLKHCGFNDFVKLESDSPIDDQTFEADKVVKIQRETSRAQVDPREREIVALLRLHSSLSEEEVELFDCVVLTEVFNNVIEHGVPQGEEGWWVLAQYHPQHQLISLCIADNGIGIRNSLDTGPQRDQIRKRLGVTLDDGDYISLALTETVSGALDAPLKAERFISGFGEAKYPRGAHRGFGMKRILRTCGDLGIPLTILSHYGFAAAGRKGSELTTKSTTKRVFGGTMYHFAVPAGAKADAIG
jgi:hypothetical protein